MSTRCSIHYTDSLHVYEQAFDTGPFPDIYLDIDRGGVEIHHRLDAAAVKAIADWWANRVEYATKTAKTTDAQIEDRVSNRRKVWMETESINESRRLVRAHRQLCIDELNRLGIPLAGNGGEA